MDDDTVTQGEAPAPQSASKFALLVSPNDLALYLGTTRSTFDAQGMGVAQRVVYSAGYSLSLTTAKQLRDALHQAVEEYERLFGAIPTEANAINTADMPGAAKT